MGRSAPDTAGFDAMEKLKQQLEQKLIANVLIDKCAHSKNLIFRDAWCTQERIIRFTLPVFRMLFAYRDGTAGKWKTGDFVMFEFMNSPNAYVVHCVFDAKSVPVEQIEVKRELLKLFDISTKTSALVTMRSWDLTPADEKANTLFDQFDRFLEITIPAFVTEIEEKTVQTANPSFVEGESSSVISNKYERNPLARAACLAAHGTSCTVCGIEFGKEYGPEFVGKIEVHHIVPLSEIGKEYVVDPIKDLVPICPNCHTALHSKPGGVYTIEELIRIKDHKPINKGE